MATDSRDGVAFGEVDGVRAMWPEGRRSGELAAMLSFRVGQADETLPLRGITHLVEHLALFRTGQAPHAYNGQTGPTLTTFGMQGTASDVTRFFATLGESLQDLPLDRLDLERGVLATEEKGRSSGVDYLWRLRWGPRGYGLLGYSEFGAQRVYGEALRAWSEERFTKQNAVLVLNGAPPRALRLPLAEGSWHAPPEPGPAVEKVPMSFVMHGEEFGLSLVRDRAAGGGEAAWLISERLNQRLRHDLGLVYGVHGGSAVLTPTTRHDIYWTHALPEKLTAAGMALVDVLAQIGEPMTDAERAQWGAHRKRAATSQASKDARKAYVAYCAEETLLGGQVQSREELATVAEQLTESELLDAAVRASSRMAVALPDGVDGSSVATPLAQHSTEQLVGRTLAPAHGQAEELVLADSGLSLVQLPGRKPVTVRFEDLAGVLAWDDGARTVLGNDGFAVAYRPEMWQGQASEVIRHIDSRIDPALVIEQGPRTPVPKPAATADRGTGARQRFFWAVFAMRTLLGAIFLMSAPAALADSDPQQGTGDKVTLFLVMLALATLLLWKPARWLWQRYQPRRG